MEVVDDDVVAIVVANVLLSSKVDAVEIRSVSQGPPNPSLKNEVLPLGFKVLDDEAELEVVYEKLSVVRLAVLFLQRPLFFVLDVVHGKLLHLFGIGFALLLEQTQNGLRSKGEVFVLHVLEERVRGGVLPVVLHERVLVDLVEEKGIVRLLFLEQKVLQFLFVLKLLSQGTVGLVDGLVDGLSSKVHGVALKVVHVVTHAGVFLAFLLNNLLSLLGVIEGKVH